MEKVTSTVDRLERFKRLVFIGNKNSKFLDFSSYFLRRYTRPLVMAAIALCATYRFIGFVFYVYGNKMEPALSDGDLVIGEAASVWGRCLWREDIIVVKEQQNIRIDFTVESFNRLVEHLKARAKQLFDLRYWSGVWEERRFKRDPVENCRADYKLLITRLVDKPSTDFADIFPSLTSNSSKSTADEGYTIKWDEDGDDQRQTVPFNALRHRLIFRIWPPKRFGWLSTHWFNKKELKEKELKLVTNPELDEV